MFINAFLSGILEGLVGLLEDLELLTLQNCVNTLIIISVVRFIS